jgi:hypothetical protein
VTEVETVRAAFDAKRQPERPGRLHELTSAYLSENGLTTKLDLRLTEDEKTRWHEYAVEHGVSVSELVRDTVNDRVR